MKTITEKLVGVLLSWYLLGSTISAVAAQTLPAAGGSSHNFNKAWAFYLGDVAGAEKISLDDSKWAAVAIPHTLRMEKKHCSGDGIYKGIGWYRRYFALNPGIKGKVINIDFQGVMIDCEVFLNGEKVATHNGGYIGFSVDVSNKIKFGENNLLAVRVSNIDSPDTPPGKPEKRLDYNYSGGIYRNVTLRIQDPLRITDPLQAQQVGGGGVFFTYPAVSKETATVHIKTHLASDRPNPTTCSIKTTILDAQNHVVGTANSIPSSIAPKSNQQVEQDIVIQNPKLWHPDHPNLYTAVSEIYVDGKTVDRLVTKIGIRRIDFKPDGFYLNGEKLYLRGANRHQQFQTIGIAAPDSMQKRDALWMKADGFNAVRAAHYPNSPAFLDACDEVGLIVVACQPGWQHFTNSQAFYDNTIRDAREMIRRDRNHPSVVLWETSLNETGTSEKWRMEVTRAAREEYPGDQLFLADDGVSNNYNVGYKVVYRRENEIDHDPKKPFITREWGDWGWGRVPRAKGAVEMIQQVVHRQMQLNGDGYDDWGGLERCERIAGVFLWSWMDYTRGFSDDTAFCGAVDINRYPKFCHYWLKSMMDARNLAYGPMAFIADYNQSNVPADVVLISNKYHNREGEWKIAWSPLNVMVFSNCDSVRLSQNGQLIEEITRTKNAESAPFIAKKGGSPYFVFTLSARLPGTLKAEGIIDGKVVSTHEVKTPEAPARIQIEPAPMGMSLLADGSDLVPVYFKVVDRNGTLIPTSSHELKITVEGAGSLVGEGIPRVEVETQKVEAGLGFAFIRSKSKAGKILIKAEAPGLIAGQNERVSVPASGSFVPDGKHLEWNNDETVFEPAIAVQEAERAKLKALQASAGKMMYPSQIESITASCPAVKGREIELLQDDVTDFGTGWLADSQALPQTLTATFKSPEKLSAVQIYFEKDSTWYSYEMETSPDGQQWNRFSDARSVTGHEKEPVIFKAPQDGTRFIRIHLKDVKTGTGEIAIGVAELKFYTQ